MKYWTIAHIMVIIMDGVNGSLPRALGVEERQGGGCYAITGYPLCAGGCGRGELFKGGGQGSCEPAALSQLIQHLEDELGVKLFVRKSNRVTLTPAGKIFYEDGKVILALSDQLIHKMNDFQSLKKGELTISVSPFYRSAICWRALGVSEAAFLASRCGLWTRFPAIRRRFWCRARWIWLL